MNEQIKNALLNGRAVLFLGAGASIGSSNELGNSPPLGGELAKVIAERCGLPYNNEDVGIVFGAAKKQLGRQLDDLLASHYRNCKPSSEYQLVASFPWVRIYTTNIDDAFEDALFKNSKQKINVKSRNDWVADKNQLYSELDYIYLNGSIRRPELGYIFSAEEYGKASASSPRWYEEVASDYLQCTFIFIGSNIKEPVFHHHVERYKSHTGTGAPQSYVILPAATPIEIASFDSGNLKYVQGTLKTFVEWLKATIPTVPEPLDIAQNRTPELKNLLDKVSPQSKQAYAELMEGITIVSRQALSSVATQAISGATRSFYKGFKPHWSDIVDGIPAELDQYRSLRQALDKAVAASKDLVAIIGPAGSGKSTALKWLALSLSDSEEKVYFLERGNQYLVSVLLELEKSNSTPYFLFVERLDSVKTDLQLALQKTSRAIVIGAESQNIWHNRLLAHVDASSTEIFELREIVEDDVAPILQKLERYGPWTRLATLKPADRKREIFNRSKRQLLIGLMEATTGIGFDDIVMRDFNSVVEQDRTFFLMACIATMHRTNLSLSVAARALSHLAKSEPPETVVLRLRGIVEAQNNRYVARHPIYARKIIESIADRQLLSEAITALLMTYTVYPHPVVKMLDRNDSALFKSIINHKFLESVFRNDSTKILGIYSQFEKHFESDGLYWLQYGLSMRSFGRNVEAYELLQTAYNAYPHDHTIHAYAQQKLILAADDLIPEEMARAYIADARNLLSKLDDILESDDTYPIVTLAEGHVKALRKLDGDVPARVRAREYVNLLTGRLRKGNNPRLEAARDRLTIYATTGTWRDE